MQYIRHYQSDKMLAEVGDLPLLKVGCIIRLGKSPIRYKVMDISDNRKITEIYVSDDTLHCHPFATADYTLDIVKC